MLLTASLQAVGRVMLVAQDPWWVIASAALALHGADPGDIGDVDILLSVDDAARILPSIGVEPHAGPAHPDFRSDLFATWHGTALPVEFMAGFRYRSGTDWVRVQPTRRQRVDIAGVAVYIPDRAELVRLLEAFGRPKDIARLRRLRLIQSDRPMMPLPGNDHKVR